MRLAVIVGALLLSATVAGAEIYEWTDERGVRHWSDNPNRVPEQYRAKPPAPPGAPPQPAEKPRSAPDEGPAVSRGELPAIDEVLERSGLRQQLALLADQMRKKFTEGPQQGPQPSPLTPDEQAAVA